MTVKKKVNKIVMSKFNSRDAIINYLLWIENNLGHVGLFTKEDVAEVSKWPIDTCGKILRSLNCHHQDGSDLMVDANEVFNIIFNRVIGEQAVKKHEKGLSKAITLLKED